MYQLYELKKSQCILQCTPICFSRIEKIKLTNEVTGKTLKGRCACLYWNLVSMGKIKVYAIRDEKRIIHSSYVLRKCFKFPFLRRECNDIEIGPSMTSAEYRGQGLYPYILTEIVNKELEEGDKAYMIVDENNISSIRGIKKVGFICTANLERDWMKRYIIKSSIKEK